MGAVNRRQQRLKRRRRGVIERLAGYRRGCDAGVAQVVHGLDAVSVSRADLYVVVEVDRRGRALQQHGEVAAVDRTLQHVMVEVAVADGIPRYCEHHLVGTDSQSLRHGWRRVVNHEGLHQRTLEPNGVGGRNPDLVIAAGQRRHIPLGSARRARTDGQPGRVGAGGCILEGPANDADVVGARGHQRDDVGPAGVRRGGQVCHHRRRGITHRLGRDLG